MKLAIFDIDGTLIQPTLLEDRCSDRDLVYRRLREAVCW